MNISEQKLNELIGGIISAYGKKGSISTNALWERLHRNKMPLELALTAPKGTINRWNVKEKIKNG